MKNLRNILFFLFGIAVLAGLAWLIWNVVRWVTSLGPSYLGPTVTAILGFIGIIYTQWHSKSREIQQSHRPQKIEVYNCFFELLERFLNNPGEQKTLDEGGEESLPEDLRDQFWQLNKGLIVWASPAVIRSWLHFREESTSGGNTLLAMDKVLMSIRKDLGNSNFSLQEGDSVKIFLKDPSEFDEAGKAEKDD
ncbi:hypothetical protein [Gimesia fumaroli]|uniref:Uncharacterized protein n=1 Tax=Gimesia fumaroli TaxID=2527976 RepID=A0A518IC79_9PLAN|nr:hypothetical protein [Gimesia fumaroli]QDV50695.1 hypothetical protein Enr17x_27370 [Gimesia fumaroli]